MDPDQSAADTLDPVRSMTDLAKLMARLGEPSARASDVLTAAHTTAEALDAAKLKWAREMKGNEMLARLYGQLFSRERTRLRGEPDRVQPPAAAAPTPPASGSVDETAEAMLGLGLPALPFVEGTFQPLLEPVTPRVERPFDPDETQQPAAAASAALPFVGTQPGKKR